MKICKEVPYLKVTMLKHFNETIYQFVAVQTQHFLMDFLKKNKEPFFLIMDFIHSIPKKIGPS